LKILILADDEFVVKRIQNDPVDVLISLGDLSQTIIYSIAERCQPVKILAVKGNHDDDQPFRPPIHDLHLKTFEYQGIQFGGFGGSWRFKQKGSNLYKQEEVEHLLQSFPAVDVFLAHNSPRLIHDRDDGCHLGFYAFNQYIERAKPKLFLHGHQHHDQQTLIGNTFVIGNFGHRSISIMQKPKSSYQVVV